MFKLTTYPYLFKEGINTAGKINKYQRI